MTFTLEQYKLHESRVFRDPIHGYIHIHYQPIWHLINTKEVQRLRRIHQLGGTYMVFHGAEHSRFSHSLGVYEVVRRILELETFDGHINDYERLTCLCAALLHDVGHGPFSHTFENVFAYSHELYTKKIIMEEETQIHTVLSSIHPNLPRDVSMVIEKTHPNKLLWQIVSSQIDADRMDYLLRDSYFTGTAYGKFDIERIMRTMRVHDGSLMIKESGIQAVENYILARYHMYWQVYLHPTTRSYEQLLVTIFNRLKDLKQSHYAFSCDISLLECFLEDREVSVKHYLKLDEHALMYYFSCLQDELDPIISDLTRRFVNRELLKHTAYINEEQVETIKQNAKEKGYDTTYYVLMDDASSIPYEARRVGAEVEEIKILMSDGRIEPLDKVSEIVKAIVDTKMRKEDRRIYYPK